MLAMATQLHFWRLPGQRGFPPVEHDKLGRAWAAFLGRREFAEAPSLTRQGPLWWPTAALFGVGPHRAQGLGGTVARSALLCLLAAGALSVLFRAGPAAAANYEYRLFQFHTQSMDEQVSEFPARHPEWELVSMTALDFQGQGTVSVLFLARRAKQQPLPSQATTIPVTSGPRRVEAVLVPGWASEGGYADAVVAAIEDRLAEAPPRHRALPVLVDVVIDTRGVVLLAATRNGKADPRSADAAVNAVRAASPLGAIPDGINAAQLSERSFTFRFSL